MTVDWAGPRDEAFAFELLDRDEQLLGTLDGVESGSLEYSIHTEIRSHGQLDLTATGQDIDWLTTRIRASYTMATGAGATVWPLGVFLPATPSRTHRETSVAMPVDLYDKTKILAVDVYDETLTIPAGTSITGTVDDLITATGELNRSIEPDTAVLRSPMTFDAGTTRLQVINRLLDAADYGALWCDGWGQFRAERRLPPAQRGIAWDFASGDQSIHSADFTWQEDYFSVPNRCTLIGRTDGDVPPLISRRTLDEVLPGSKFGYAALGYWVSRVDQDVEATSQAVLDAMCARRLIDGANVTRTVDIEHAMLPLRLNDVVTFRDDGVVEAVLGMATVTQMRVPLMPGELMSTTLRGVVG